MKKYSVYDIMQVENDAFTAKLVEGYLKRMGFSYASVSSLESLQRELDTGASARCYVLDCHFPRSDEPGAHDEYLAVEAYDYIRKKSGSPVVVFSSDCGDPAAEMPGVAYVRKDGRSVPKLFSVISSYLQHAD